MGGVLVRLSFEATPFGGGTLESTAARFIQGSFSSNELITHPHRAWECRFWAPFFLLVLGRNEGMTRIAYKRSLAVSFKGTLGFGIPRKLANIGGKKAGHLSLDIGDERIDGIMFSDIRQEPFSNFDL